MTNLKALQLIEQGFRPVLLGRRGDDLKRPVLKGWQTAVYTPEDIALWPAGNNIGIRCGPQPNGRILTVLDFDEEAERVFPAWRKAITCFTSEQMVIVASSRGYHVYLYVATAYRGRTLAGRIIEVDGRPRLHKFIETIGIRRQVVTAGSRHPSGWQYRFLGPFDYRHIPTLMEEQFQECLAVARTFDERPLHPLLKSSARPANHNSERTSIHNCLDYARRFLSSQEQVEGNGDIRFLGHGGLLVTADGRGWYSFSEDRGGGLPELIAWHQSWVGEG
jgi:hypothetical protein